MKNVLFAVMGLLALSVVPVSGHAAAHRLPGEKCGPAYDTVQIGTTAMADDRQNIIACLETGEKTQDGKDDSEWKAMTSSGGGGLTGGCAAGVYAAKTYYGTIPQPDGWYLYSTNLWGKGCDGKRIKSTSTEGALNGQHPCTAVASPGYVCGESSNASYDNQAVGSVCLCVKK